MAIINTGYRGRSEAGHANSVAVSWGPEAKAKGVKGAFLVLAEWKNNGGNHWKEDTWDFVGAAMVRVDGEDFMCDACNETGIGEYAEFKEVLYRRDYPAAAQIARKIANLPERVRE